jgi:hypothetical protein
VVSCTAVGMLLSVCALAMLTYCSAAICSTNSSKIESLYIVDQLNYRIRVVSPVDVSVSTLAGNGISAAIDGFGTSASFKAPLNSGLSRGGNTLYVTDGSCIRSVRLDDGFYEVKTIIGNCLVSGKVPGGISVARLGSNLKIAADVGDKGLYISDIDNGQIDYFDFQSKILSYVVAAAGARFTFSFYQSNALYVSKNADYVLFCQPNVIYIANLTSSQVGSFAGSASSGTADGVGTLAKFYSISSIVATADETKLYVADYFSRGLRLVTFPGAVVTTIPVSFQSDFVNFMTLSMNELFLYAVVAGTSYHYYHKIDIVAKVYSRSGGVSISASSGYVDGILGSAKFYKPTSCNIGNFYAFSTCSRCDVGKYQNVSEQTLMCVTCPIATYASVDFSACQTCPMGTYSSATAASACQGCAPGSFGTVSGVTSSSVCQTCSAGTYTSVSGSSSCVACAAGMYSTASAANSSSVCQSCALGSFGVVSGATSSSVCQICSAGAYTSVPGTSVCVVCAAGKYGTSSGATSISICQSCALGSFGNVSGATSNFSCYPCSPGAYTSVSARSVCTQCATGKYGTASSATSLSICQTCSAGSFASVSGSTVCSGCGAGKYATALATTSSSVCVACNAGTYTSVSHSSVCGNCSAGNYTSGLGASACQQCGAGNFSFAAGSTVCQQCWSGFYQPQTGQTVCLVCPAGQYCGSEGTTIPQNCSAGNFSGSGASECSKCPIGYTSEVGASNCTAIPVVGPVEVVIVPCEVGYYGLSPSCNPCPSNTNSSFNHTLTVLDCRCLAGYVCSYKKRINVRLTLLNITWDLLNVTNIANSQIIDAIAAAAGVPRANVIINGIVGAGRRMMHESDFDLPEMDSSTDNGITTIQATVWEASSLNDALATTLLDPYLVDSISWTHGHSVRVAKVWGSLM